MGVKEFICIFAAALGIGFGIGMYACNLTLKDDLQRRDVYIEKLESHFNEIELQMIRG